ncbi:hypothetical protein B7L88_gp087 [Rhizobium phage RHEph10]|uniref:hypothetical protein n=1 Tax=Rhizobium phage RHEph10 TaxID=1220717 RepID=UPI0002AAF700|nr:hypothetical protein B7L88_gp087 [Rhizobium phage RHEph10]AGC36201.1 hypothetical protein RHEph10_gp158 [Rhizobium phage RHEph10]
MSQQRLVDPIHFFNSCGLSAVSEVFYLEVIEKLRADNERLTRLVERAKNRGLLEQEN